MVTANNASDDNDNGFFGAAPIQPSINAGSDDIDRFAQAIEGHFNSPKLTARLSPSQSFVLLGSSIPPRSSSVSVSASASASASAHPSVTPIPATPLARTSINRSTSPCHPVLSPSDFTVATASSVADILRSPKILVLDIRPHSAYSAARLPHAISLSVPSTLLRRPAFTLQKLATMLPSASARARFQSWGSASRILVYDADSATLTDGSNLLGLLRKFRSAGFAGDVAWLQGGIQALWRDNRHLIDERSVSDDEEDADSSEALRTRKLPQAAFQQATTTIIRPSPGSLTMPSWDSLPQAAQSTQSTTSVRVAPANPFYDNIRQNVELSQGITERIPLKLSPTTASRTKELPFTWLRDIAKTAGHDEGTEALAMQFYRIELGEQRRLQGIMAHHSMQIDVVDNTNTDDTTIDGKKDGKSFPYSIVAGVEKGIKNRYRNIWPFEHSRVRLRDQSHDDYVNASYVHPLGTRRKFIATQGPLPSTFVDFWSVVWQQDVRIIVMLTKECEQGSIKCGKYWADGEYGRIRLKCISVSGATEKEEQADDASGGGGGFFNAPPPPKEGVKFTNVEDRENNSTIRRVFELSRIDRLDEPPRIVTQLQYLGWPDMDVPVNPRSVLRLLFEVDEMADRDALESGDLEKRRPVLLHCSAGVGRTGAFIMIDAALDGVRREIRKRARAREVARARVGSGSGTSASEGEGQSDSDVAMDIDVTPFGNEQKSPAVTSTQAQDISKSAVVPPTPQASSLIRNVPDTPTIQVQTAPLHIGGEKSGGQADIHVPVVPANEGPIQSQPGSGMSMPRAGPSRHPMPIASSLLNRRMSRPFMQRPVKSDFTIADADSMFVSAVPNPDFAMDVQPLSKQARGNNSSSGEGTTSSGDNLKASSSVSSGTGSASDGRMTGPLQKAFATMSSADDSPGSPDRLRAVRMRHRIGGSDGTGNGEGAGGSASESSGPGSSNANKSGSHSRSGGYSSSSSLGLGGFAGMAVGSPAPSSGYVSPSPSASRATAPLANRGRHRTPRNVAMQKPSLLAPKPLHLKSQMPELTEGVETNVQTAPGALPPLADLQSSSSVRSNLSSSSSFASFSTDSTSSTSLCSTSQSGHTTDTQDTPISMHKASRSPSAEKGGATTSDRSVFDYTEPRELHGDNSPLLLSSLQEPLRQILEDMREQRMSLCQSLRQYVFVHNAIIGGALVVAEQESKRLNVDPREVFDPDSPPPPASPPKLSAAAAMMGVTGKRGASPTELLKEDKKGDVALVKRPSVKRGKSTSSGESTSPTSI